MRQKQSKKEMYDHSKIKVELLQKYMSSYLGILSNSPWIKSIFLYDLFCGPGIYENDSEGSPIIFLKEINNAIEYISKQRIIDTKFSCIFNDKDNNKIDKLKLSIKRLNLDKSKFIDTFYVSEDYKIILEKVINHLNSLHHC